MPVDRLADLTWEEVRERSGEGSVAVLPVGAVEAHGPHLPLITDGIIAEAMAREGARRLSERGLHVLLLPLLPYTAAPFAAGFPGTLSVDPDAVTLLVRGIAESLGRHGVPRLAVANVHLDPAHLRSLASVGDALPGGAARVVCPDLTRRPWALRLGEEFRSGAAHAGRYEGSVVLAERGEAVREEVRRGLTANPSSLSRAIREGRTTFEEAGGPRAYFGDPAAATAEEGRATVAELGRILEEAVLEAAGAHGGEAVGGEQAVPEGGAGR